MTRSPEEALCADGLVCFPGAGGMLHLSRGVRLLAPERRAAINRVPNQICACLAQAMGVLPEGGKLQMQWRVSNDLQGRIKSYAQATPADAPVAVQQYRNQKAIHFLKAVQAGRLHREEVTLWLGQDVPHAKPSREDRKDPGLFITASCPTWLPGPPSC